MKVIRKNGKRYLCWGYHELAWSRRTSMVVCPFFDAGGNKVGELETEKRPGMVEIPENACYWLRRYWTNRGYPEHTLYQITDDNLIPIMEITRGTAPEDVMKQEIPEGLKEWILQDVFADC